ncbi:uncharacterized protein BO66DRAFT_108266 [Aspergillus aculeatinus CBS 121060]|uniref:Uncharacterized protein n=1 Tax=Aspergillus aculeatinus CBS 121060 TaxID=1448322 RepID=A0ACD1HLN1_9EURO|nr:hypothetical protein BO66DRAFT_108266 [Aspergillus aculeatinus CBS 121060]RAH74475.1 hypothetical protein BO66DRAFT_108266 [Aspergillus aculeatinus CBS 121060]
MSSGEAGTAHGLFMLCALVPLFLSLLLGMVNRRGRGRRFNALITMTGSSS